MSCCSVSRFLPSLPLPHLSHFRQGLEWRKFVHYYRSSFSHWPQHLFFDKRDLSRREELLQEGELVRFISYRAPCSSTSTPRHTRTTDIFHRHLCRRKDRRKTQSACNDHDISVRSSYIFIESISSPSSLRSCLPSPSRSPPRHRSYSPTLFPLHNPFLRSTSLLCSERCFVSCRPSSRMPLQPIMESCLLSGIRGQHEIPLPFFTFPPALYVKRLVNFNRIHQRFFAISHINPSISKGTVSYRVPNPYIPIILLRNVEGIGMKGQLTQVRRGTYRHVLQPRKLAVVATWQNIDRYYLLRKEKKAYEKAEGRRTGSVRDQVFDGKALKRASEGGIEEQDERKTEESSRKERSTRKDTNQSMRSIGEGKEGDRALLDELQEDHSEQSIYSYLDKYRPTFLVDTEETDSATIQGDGVSIYDVLERLTLDIELDLLPSQIFFYRRLGDSRHTTEDIAALQSRKDEEMYRGEITSGVAEDEEMRREGRIRKCGLYEVYLILPTPRAQQNRKRSFILEVSSKQERIRLLKERQRREEEEAKRLDFSLGDM
ncbi:ribosomal protein n-terminal domain-containing protein [Cystoisospora suis]|uniref:Ribosomal protein n-terminal domain-containing protein n=1 Tax=Cystoisospora suis TaxID=483139 RepID=A0A2C6KMK1_9APIC|nr:ribosomal protein n-terminal domain-containing protein [Cystoisospora suis]